MMFVCVVLGSGVRDMPYSIRVDLITAMDAMRSKSGGMMQLFL